jgi:hypothetical protein
MSVTRKILRYALACIPLWCGAAEPIGVVTIADGDALVFRKTQKIQLKVGSKLWAQDILQSDPKSTLVRAELNKGGIFDFGPGTVGMLHPSFNGNSGRVASVYLLKGWLKVSAAPSLGAASSTVLGERLEVSEAPGSAVMSAQADGFVVFAETGALSVLDRRLGKSALPTSVGAGAVFVADPGGKPALSAKVPGGFIQSVPKGFRETIPALLPKFKSTAGPADKIVGELSYADAGPWLAAEPAVRKQLVTLWSGQLPADLRQGLERHIAAHPEWRATLFPVNDPVRKAPAPGLGPS